MKRIYLLLAVSVLFAACGGTQKASEMQQTQDSLMRALSEKDSMINDVFLAMNAVSDNLEAIKSREKIINKNIETGEIPKSVVTRISEDIDAINQLLEENRQTIARLERSAAQLKQANLKIASLDKVIAQLNQQVEEKNQEIEVLKASLRDMSSQLADLNRKVTGLNTKVSSLAQEKASLEGEVQTQTDALHTGYYIIGSEKDLIDKGVVVKSGFIGRTLKITDNRNMDRFTQIDTRYFHELPIGYKKVTLISSHPADSYRFTMNDKGNYESLEITDSKSFWEASKVLVISYK